MDITPRKEWGARAPDRRHEITTPTPELWLHHTAGDEYGAGGMRSIQAFHMDRREWSDIGYSFVIDGSSLEVFEGRGAGIAGGHTEGHNTISHGICVMGNFDLHKPSDELLDTIAELVAYGHRRHWWAWPMFSGGHRDTKPTRCPGEHLYAQLAEINARASNIVENGNAEPVILTDEWLANSKWVQENLLALFGGYTGEIDGKYGPQTRAAAETLRDNHKKALSGSAKAAAAQAAVAAIQTAQEALHAALAADD